MSEVVEDGIGIINEFDYEPEFIINNPKSAMWLASHILLENIERGEEGVTEYIRSLGVGPSEEGMPYRLNRTVSDFERVKVVEEFGRLDFKEISPKHWAVAALRVVRMTQEDSEKFMGISNNDWVYFTTLLDSYISGKDLVSGEIDILKVHLNTMFNLGFD